MEKKKLKFAFYWAASCGDCEIAVLDINEKILDIVAKVDIVFWPVTMDIEYKDEARAPLLDCQVQLYLTILILIACARKLRNKKILGLESRMFVVRISC